MVIVDVLFGFSLDWLIVSYGGYSRVGLSDLVLFYFFEIEVLFLGIV